MLNKHCFAILTTLFMIVTFAANALAYGDSFSCSFGKQGACLDYGDKVCSSRSKCVSNDAICFDSYTCDFNGFVCKSKFDDLANEYDDLLYKFKKIATEHDDLVNEYNEILRKYKNVAAEYEDLQNCIAYASTLDEARNCY